MSKISFAQTTEPKSVTSLARAFFQRKTLSSLMEKGPSKMQVYYMNHETNDTDLFAITLKTPKKTRFALSYDVKSPGNMRNLYTINVSQTPQNDIVVKTEIDGKWYEFPAKNKKEIVMRMRIEDEQKRQEFFTILTEEMCDSSDRQGLLNTSKLRKRITPLGKLE